MRCIDCCAFALSEDNVIGTSRETVGVHGPGTNFEGPSAKSGVHTKEMAKVECAKISFEKEDDFMKNLLMFVGNIVLRAAKNQG
jgi:hypothetical protein